MNWSIFISRAQAASFDTSHIDLSNFGQLSLAQIANNIISALQYTIVPLGVALFAVGAFMYTISGGSEDRKSQGKDFMIGSLIGVAVVLGAKMILNFIIYFLYG